VGKDELLSPHTHAHEDQVVYVIKPRKVQHTFWNKKNTPVRYIELSGRDGFEKYVDSHQKGLMYSITHGEKKLGMTFHINRISELFVKYQSHSSQSTNSHP